MNTEIESKKWAEFLKDYSKRNEDRPTRLGVFERTNGIADDFWIEDGLPLLGLDAYPTKGAIHVDILFEAYTHPIDGVASIVEVDEGLDISDTKGRTTVLRFEDWPITKEM